MGRVRGLIRLAGSIQFEAILDFRGQLCLTSGVCQFERFLCRRDGLRKSMGCGIRRGQGVKVNRLLAAGQPARSFGQLNGASGIFRGAALSCDQ